MHYNPSTGEQNRLWIRYGDNTFEPVRKNGNVNRKSRNKPDAPDWWVTERPQGWDPRDYGHDVTPNHDYGEHDKPGRQAKGELPRQNMFLRREDMGKAKPQTMDYRYGRDDKGNRNQLFDEKTRPAADTPASNKSTIAQGGEGFWEYEAKRKAAEAESGKSGDGQAVTPRNSAQDAERVKGWEKSTGNGTAGVDADKLLDNLPKDEAQTQQWFDAFGRIDQSALTPAQQRRLYDAASEVYGQPGPARQDEPSSAGCGG